MSTPSGRVLEDQESRTDPRAAECEGIRSVKRVRGFLTMGLEGDAPWPSAETTFCYRNREITLRPETEDDSATISVAVSESSGPEEARQFVYEFLSALAWVNGRGVTETFSVVSGKGPMSLRERKARLIGDAPRSEYVPAPDAPQAKLALALYREAVCANMVTFQFLSFFKIINVVHAKKSDQVNWINTALPNIKDYDARKRLAQISKHHPDVGDYLYVSGRCAVAHAFSTPVANPDNPKDTQRLLADLPLMKALAEHAIESELGVKTVSTIMREHLYELEGFRELFGPKLVSSLKSEDTVDAASIPIPNRLSLRLMGRPQYKAFEGLKADVPAAEDGTVVLRLHSDDDLMVALVRLHFRQERLTFDAMQDVAIRDDDSSTAARVLADYVRYQRDWLGNGVVEVWDPSRERRLGRSEVVVPRNVMINDQYFEDRLNELRKRISESADG